MKITLFLPDSLINFKLPHIVSGNFTYDANKDSESKLINVEAINGRWVLYSTPDSKIYMNNNYYEKVYLDANHFYYLEKDNAKYVIYVSNLNFDGLLSFSFKEEFTLGNMTNNSIYLNCPFINGLTLKFKVVNKNVTLEKTGDNYVYLNQKRLNSKNYQLSYGDILDVYGLQLIFLKDIVLMNNNPYVTIKDDNLVVYNFPNKANPENIELKDTDLYQKDDYYSKSPRIRRIIKTKEIKLSTPPREENGGELPLVLTIGPMLTMGVMSITTFMNTLSRVTSGEVSYYTVMPQLITSGAMIVSMLFWPLVIQWYNRFHKRRKKKEIIKKYTKYLDSKRLELEKERELQKVILLENLITIEDCIQNISNHNLNFWDKRVDQSDFLVVRVGVGDAKMDVKIDYPEEGFTIDESILKDRADDLVKEFTYIKNVPISYSFYENKITAIMGENEKSLAFVKNIILQLITFYTYEDLKICLFTNEKNSEQWKFLKYLNHNFSNEKDIRFYSTNKESAKDQADYLNFILNLRKGVKKDEDDPHKPHYFIIVDGWDSLYQNDNIKALTEEKEDLGFTILIIENKMGKLPSKCNNFITLDGASSKILKNAYDEQEQIDFNLEVHYNVPMVELSKILSNIPIEFEDGFKELPNSISFLEMEGVGKVSQLNILNRWNTMDSTSSLRAPIGVDEKKDLIYLDLHEKYHGPHGLIAGMTGSGKSEFIITYILSMAINYSPNDVSFILIDYKGGGLAYAFENRFNNIVLPHLAGTITNLDKSEMDRTLVSIDSEIKYRQELFNEARDILGESTMDIYKYQRFFKEGRLSTAVPHLFIICDEFAELKANQPDFMDNLISVARIGRSLGVHLILATQKPSGVVNDQIWSNSKFRVCLKVQDESDSKEMLKKPDAAGIRETGRFYLQVGYDEYFVLGQSAWCGAKYYPSDKIIKQIDKSINYINDNGRVIKSIQAANTKKVEAKGEQIAAILEEIIKVSNETNCKSRRLWLENIPEVILEEDISKKYNFVPTPFQVKAVIGEYDAPENQSQGVVIYDFLKDGNTIIYGNDGVERELLLDTIIYSSIKYHTVDEVNYYIIDYGSESLRKYKTALEVGGLVFAGEDEKFNNLLKLIKEEIEKRKKILADYGSDYTYYIQNNKNKIPLKVVVINNYDSLYESYPNIYDELPNLVRDSERLGIVFIFTASLINSIPSKISANCKNIYAFKLKDKSDYNSLFNTRDKVVPRDIFGRGILNNDGLHEFQTASICKKDMETTFFQNFIAEQNKMNREKAKKIPVLPDIVRFDDVKNNLKSINEIPVGLSKELDIITYNFLTSIGNIITSNKLINTKIFTKSLLTLMASLKNINILVIDVVEELNLDKNTYPNYYTKDIPKVLNEIKAYINKLINNKSNTLGVLLINGFNKFVDKVEDKALLEEFFKIIKKYEKFSIIAVDDVNKFKNYNFEAWFTSIFSMNDGIWIGRGIADQSLFRISSIKKEMMANYNNDMGYVINENVPTLVKFVDLISKESEKYEK